MTPTLKGRLQTRMLLVGLIGLPITLPFCVLAFPFVPMPLLALLVVWGVGSALDPLYDWLQRRRWDHDWPVWAQVLAGITEGLLAFVLLSPLTLLNPLFLLLYPAHYVCVWGAMFLLLQGPIQVLLPRWRFQGGEFTARRKAMGRSKHR